MPFYLSPVELYTLVPGPTDFQFPIPLEKEEGLPLRGSAIIAPRMAFF